MTRQSNMLLQIPSCGLGRRYIQRLSFRPRRQPVFRARAVDRLGAPLDDPATRRGAGFVGDVRATGRSAAKLLFNTSIKLMTFGADGVVGTAFFGSSARFSLSFEIKTVR